MAAVAEPSSRPGSEWMRLVRFLCVGGLNTAFGYAVFTSLSLLGCGPSASAIGATMLGILFNFRSIGTLVFGRRGDWSLLPRFIAVYGAQTASNILLLRVAARAGVPTLLAEACILPPLALLTFVLLRRFVFMSGRLPAERGSQS